MNKKLLYIAPAALLALASCSQQELEAPAAPGDGNVHFTVSLPHNVATRALDSGLVANELMVAVYDADNGNQYIFNNDGEFVPTSQTPLTTTVDMKLATGKSYTIVFFAASANALTETPVTGDDGTTETLPAVYVFDFDPADGQPSLQVNYESMTSEGMLAEDYDCFYSVYETGEINGTLTDNITLSRPIAQINWGTDDIAEEAAKDDNAFGSTGQYIMTNLTVNAYSQMNLLTGAMMGDQTEVELQPFESLSDEVPAMSFPVNPQSYTYIAMQYLLAPSGTSATYNLSLNINNSANPGTNVAPITNDIVATNAPVQANYQTNIYGSLLTDNTSFTVTKDKEWTTPNDFNIEVGVSKPAFDENSNTYTITSQPELAWVAQQVNSNGEEFAGVTFKQVNNIYLTGNWTPIGVSSFFKGTYDGGENTIYNMVVDVPDYAGFFGQMYGSVKNLNFDNATVNSDHYAGVVAAYNSNNSSSNVIENCTVSNSSVTLDPTVMDASGDYNGDKGGIIIGYMQSNISMTDCHVIDCSLSGYRDLGGLTGFTTGNTFTNCTVDGLTIIINNKNNYQGYEQQSQYNAGALYGRVNTAPTLNNCTSSNVNIIFTSTPGSSAINATVSSLEGVQAVVDLIEDEYGPAANISFTEQVKIDFENEPIESLDLFRGGYNINVDFNGATFSNITLTDDNPYVFYRVKGMIQNLTIEGISGNISGAGEFAAFIGAIEEGSTLSNITITDVNISAPNKNQVGALGGILNTGVNVSNVSVTGGSITGNVSVGGVFGTITGTGTLTEVTVNGLTVTSSEPAILWDTYLCGAGAITGGLLMDGRVFEDCSVVSTTVNDEEATYPIESNSTTSSYTWNTTLISPSGN